MRSASIADALDLAGRGVDARGDVAGDDRRAGLVGGVDRRLRRAREARRRSRSRRSRRRSPPEPASAARPRRPPRSSMHPPSSRSRFARGVVAELVGRPEQEDLHLVAGLTQQARGDEAVAAVVALAAEDPDRAPGRGDPLGLAGDGRARGLHQLQRGNAALLDRPGVDRAHAVGVEERVEPASGPRRSGYPPGAEVGAQTGAGCASTTAAADSREWVSETASSTPTLIAPAMPRRPWSRSAGGLRRRRSTSTSRGRAAAPERLDRRLLGGEARRQVPAGSRARRGERPARPAVKQPLAPARGRALSARSIRSISIRSIPTPATRRPRSRGDGRRRRVLGPVVGLLDAEHDAARSSGRRRACCRRRRSRARPGTAWPSGSSGSLVACAGALDQLRGSAGSRGRRTASRRRRAHRGRR